MKDNAYIELIENYKKEIWEWKQKESQWVKDQNKLEGSKRIIDELSTKVVELGKENKRLRGDLSFTLDVTKEDLQKIIDEILMSKF